ncbi:MAG: PEP-CTERM sorting domain-containing protein [Tepidisphaeraceae bacterium]|jgi:hypothetical protein
MFSKTRLNRSFLLGLGGIASLALCGRAMADYQFMNINFSGDTNGSAPGTNPAPPPGGPITQPIAIGGYANVTGNYDSPPNALTDGTVIVNDAGTMSKAMVLSSAVPNDQLGAVWADTGYSVTSDQMTLSFDVDMLQTAPAGTLQTFTLNSPTGPSIGIVLGIAQFTASGSSIFRFGAAPTSTSGGYFGLENPNNTELDSFFTYAVGDTHHIELDANFNTDTVNAYVDGTPEVANYPMRAGFTSNDLTETFMNVNGDANYSNVVALDNIVGTVPEPASFSLLGIGALALLRRRRRAQQ